MNKCLIEDKKNLRKMANESDKNIDIFQPIFPSVIKAKILGRNSTGPTQFDDEIYTVQVLYDYKVFALFYAF